MAQQQAAATQRTMLSDFLARGRDDANFARSREASAADYERKRGDDLADQAAKTQRDQAERATRAAALQQELGIGQPTPGAAVPIPMGGANFTTAQIPPTPGRTFTNPEDVETVARVREGQQRQNIAERKAEASIEASMRRVGGMTPESRAAMIPQLMAEYGWDEKTAARKIDLVTNKLMSTSQVMPADNAGKMAGRLAESEIRGLRQQRMRLETDAEDRAIYAQTYGIEPEQVLTHITNRINQAMGSVQKPATQSRGPGPSWESILQQRYGTRPAPVQAPEPTNLSDDELDRELLGGG